MTVNNFTDTKKHYSVKEYFAILKDSDLRVEYLNGEIRFMAGGTHKHSLLCNNAGSALNQALKGKPCVSYNSDLQVFIEKRSSYVMPDASVICGKPEVSENDKNSITNPTVVVEVTSKSSKSYDYGEKFHLYRGIESLKQYVVISQEKPEVIIHTKKEGIDIWQFKTYENLEDTIYLESIDVSVLMSDLYENITFEEIVI